MQVEESKGCFFFFFFFLTVLLKSQISTLSSDGLVRVWFYFGVFEGASCPVLITAHST